MVDLVSGLVIGYVSVFFFFKQKTAYEMRISDWSSDVCSSDLIPLDLRDRNGLAWLSVIVTSTPGTAWIQYDGPSDTLLLHVFDVIDEAAWRDLIKTRYEALLLEIFE